MPEINTMNQYANRRWHFYSVCGYPGNLCSKKSIVLSCRALAINEKENRTTKRWKLIKKKGKLIRVGANSVKEKGNRDAGIGNRLNFRTSMTLLNLNLN